MIFVWDDIILLNDKKWEYILSKNIVRVFNIGVGRMNGDNILA